MSMKISFEADTRGFERATQDLANVQKKVDSLSGSVKSLATALTATKDFNVKGADGIGKAADEIKALTQSLGSLDKMQNSLRGVVELFGKLSTAIGSLGTAEGAAVLGGMDGRVGNLKQAVGDQMATAHLSQQQGIMAGKVSGAPQQLLPRRIGTSGIGHLGAEEAGGSGIGVGGAMVAARGAMMAARAGPVGMAVAGAAAVGYGLYQGAKMVEAGVSFGERTYFSEERGATKAFSQQLGITGAATNMQVGRFMGLGRGDSEEAKFRARAHEKGFSLTRARIGLRAVTSLGFSMEGAEADLSDEYSRMADRPMIEATNIASQHFGAQVQTQDPLAHGAGDALSGWAFQMARGGLAPMTAARALPRLQQLEKYGVLEDAVSGTGAYGDGFYGAGAGGLYAGQRRLGLSDAGESAMLGSAYHDPANGTARMGGAMRQFQGTDRMNLASRRGFSDIIAKTHSKFAGRAIDPNQFARTGQVLDIADDYAGDIMDGATEYTTFNKLSPQERVKLAGESQGFSERLNQPGNIFHLAQNQALMEMGVDNPMMRKHVAQLRAANRDQDAAKVISLMPNSNVTQAQALKRLSEGDASALKNIQDLYNPGERSALAEGAGMSAVGTALYGSDSVMSTATAGYAWQKQMGDTGVEALAKQGAISPLAKTQGEAVEGAKAAHEGRLMGVVGEIKGEIITAMHTASEKMVDLLVEALHKGQGGGVDSVDGGKK